MGNIWLNNWESDNKPRNTAFSGHAFLDVKLFVPFMDAVYPELSIGFGTIFSRTNDHNPEYTLIQPDGKDGFPSAFALKFGVICLFKTGHVWVGPSFQYILGIKLMNDGMHNNSTKYHNILLGATVRFAYTDEY